MNREVNIKPFEVQDLKLMKIEGGYNEEKMKQVAEIGNSGTIIYGKEILGAMGYYEMWPGVCEVWCFHNKEAGHDGVFLLVVKDALTELVKKFHRVQATGLAIDTNFVFFKKLGFEMEGLLTQYTTSKQNYIMWSRTK